MPVVFIHGVNTRKALGYDKAVAHRDALFRNVFLPAAHLVDTDVFNPYWGDNGAAFAFDLGCVPTKDEEVLELGPRGDATFASLAAAAAASVPETPQEGALVLTLARHNFVAALDVLYAAAVASADSGNELELAAFAASISQYALAHEQVDPGWLADVQDDGQLITHLRQEIRAPIEPGAEASVIALGWDVSAAWNWVSEGVDHLRDEAGAFLGKPAWNAIRQLLIPTMPRFLGDIFVYLKARGDAVEPGPITATVIGELRKAAEQRTDSDPLIVVGHSLGGMIAYDVLSGFHTGLSVDLLCTVGSQVALFEEIKAFAGSDSAITAASGGVVSRPANVAHWINIFDYNDILSYKLQPVFAGVADFNYATGDMLRAHGAYFGQPSFYRRLGDRTREALAS
ncbi:hypothetical protein [Streptomyces virginiae]|uniref:hypothetical protein n=1 Tax=Streptomyces virginiae TaxID=1961 RepID=UPI00362DC74C